MSSCGSSSSRPVNHRSWLVIWVWGASCLDGQGDRFSSSAAAASPSPGARGHIDLNGLYFS